MGPIFVTGGTGYVGRPLVATLCSKGYRVHALVRPASAAKLPSSAIPVVGNALDAATFSSSVPAGATVVHLVGTPHPNPSKAGEFRRIDLASIKATVGAATQAAAQHLIYVSVAHPAPVMQAYIAVRQEGEDLVRATGIPATILRPWYVLGPGHRWPYLLVPIYAVLGWLPSTRDGALRLGLVTREQMVEALVQAIEAPATAGVRVMEVAAIKRGGLIPSRDAGP